MDLVELEKKIDETIEKEDIADENIEAKRDRIRRIIEKIVKNRRERIDITAYVGANEHKIRMFSNGEVEIDGQRFDINTIPVQRIEEILNGIGEEDLIISTKRF